MKMLMSFLLQIRSEPLRLPQTFWAASSLDMFTLGDEPYARQVCGRAARRSGDGQLCGRLQVRSASTGGPCGLTGGPASGSWPWVWKEPGPQEGFVWTDAGLASPQTEHAFLFRYSAAAASQPRLPGTLLCRRICSPPTPPLSVLQPTSSPGRSLPPTLPDTQGVD